MTAIIGNILVALVLIAVVFFAVRSLVRRHKSGGCCGGDCGSCGCGCGCSSENEEAK